MIGIRTVLALMFSALGLAACAPTLGGTPGPEALTCDPADETCLAVNQDLEILRRNIGGECGTPTAEVQQNLFELEVRALRHLAAALGDRDLPVAQAAAEALTAIGGQPLVMEFCKTSPRPFCPRAEAAAREAGGLKHTGRWQGQLLGRGPGGRPLELTLPERGGGLLRLDGAELPVVEVKRYGVRVDVWFHQGHDQQRFVLRLGGPPLKPTLTGTWIARGERHPEAVSLTRLGE
ncbi:MAG TPA: hypothetical protein PK668_09915 [Myxococcota bacterium]|nr:hypothetical protein [Myxococcota bacterium]HRY93519.1 hypothetical protein [Myxococcota bacterium]HSA23712.1 hypothetical protein [Myxococcota bacterium]